ncbi:hypothetical protein RZS08_25015, partial [Arthrospira platensis SPKY1]|nr:hypothetical protein [Arthrospira platensis SPKY1]
MTSNKPLRFVWGCTVSLMIGVWASQAVAQVSPGGTSATAVRPVSEWTVREWLVRLHEASRQR